MNQIMFEYVCVCMRACVLCTRVCMRMLVGLGDCTPVFVYVFELMRDCLPSCVMSTIRAS